MIGGGAGMSLADEEGEEELVTPAARLCMPCKRPGIRAGFTRLLAAACCRAACNWDRGILLIVSCSKNTRLYL